MLGCSITRRLWWNSPWQIKIDAFQHMELESWISLMLGKDCPLPLSAEDHEKLIQFLVITVERSWRIRNELWNGKTPADWSSISRSLNCSYLSYWQANHARRCKRLMLSLKEALSWQPPMQGELKINFDTVFLHNTAVTGCLPRNSNGIILRVWVNRFPSAKPFLCGGGSGYPSL